MYQTSVRAGSTHSNTPKSDHGTFREPIVLDIQLFIAFGKEVQTSYSKTVLVNVSLD